MDIKELLEITLITCNRKEKLRNTLNQILCEKSPIKDFEIKILDNASVDGTEELIKEYQNTHTNLTYIKNNRNVGGNGNIVKAFELAQKEYLWVICDDDFYNWNCWNDIEQAICEQYDVIFTRTVEKKKDNTINPGSLFATATFLPACIYKTSNITNTVIFNMVNNIPNFFPHLAPLAKNINDNNRFYFPDSNIVEIGPNTDGSATYYRNMQSSELPETFRKTFWSVGYYCSLELITDKKKRLEIMDHPVYPFHSLYQNLCNEIFLNKAVYNDYFYNYFKIFRQLPIKQKLMFIAAYIQISCLSMFFDSNKSFLKTSQMHTDYVKSEVTKKHVKKLFKKYKNKKVLIYGAGIIADNLFSEYDFRCLDIIGIADRKFVDNDPGSVYGFRTVKPSDMKNLDFDIVLFTIMHPERIKEELQFKGIKKPMDSFVKKIFGFVV